MAALSQCAPSSICGSAAVVIGQPVRPNDRAPPAWETVKRSVVDNRTWPRAALRGQRICLLPPHSDVFELVMDSREDALACIAPLASVSRA